jgi:hypothetical protein
MTPEEKAREIVKLVDSVGVGREDMVLWVCNIQTAIAQALKEQYTPIIDEELGTIADKHASNCDGLVCPTKLYSFQEGFRAAEARFKEQR